MKQNGFDGASKILNVKSLVNLAVQGVLIAIISLVSYIIGQFTSLEVATSMAFVTLGIAQLLHCFNSKLVGSIFTKDVFSNKFMNLSVFSTAFIIIFLVFTPVGFAFGLTILKVWQFVVAIILAILIIPMCEILKRVYKKI